MCIFLLQTLYLVVITRHRQDFRLELNILIVVWSCTGVLHPYCEHLLVIWEIYDRLGFRGGKPPLILVARFARINVADYVR